MILERTAAYVLAVVCVFQTLLPSWTIRPLRWRSIDVQLGRLHLEARNEANSATRMPLLHRGLKEPKSLTICINDGDCITAWLDGTSHAWMISRGESEQSASVD